MSIKMQSAKDLLFSIVNSLVENKESVRVDVTNDSLGVLFVLYVDKSDMGRVIGKEGGLAKSIRTILRAVGMKDGARVNLKIHDPEFAQPRHYKSIESI